jgi:hypothetical protein
MTLVLAGQEDNHAVMGGDRCFGSASSAVPEIYTREEPKIWQAGDVLLGCAGSGRLTKYVEFASTRHVIVDGDKVTLCVGLSCLPNFGFDLGIVFPGVVGLADLLPQPHPQTALVLERQVRGSGEGGRTARRTFATGS